MRASIAQLPDHVLLEMQNISARTIDEFRKRRVHALPVRALHAQDMRCLS